MKQKSTNRLYCPDGYVDSFDNDLLTLGKWRENDNRLTSISKQGTNNYSKSDAKVRENFKRYFSSQSGAVPWQTTVLTSTSCYFDEFD